MMTDEEFLRIARYMKQRYGIDLSQKKVIMNGRLENHIKSGGWNSFNAFMNDMEKDSSGQLEKALVNLLTTNHTYFMREFEHFEFFKSVVLPELRQREQSTRDLRIWCGAASTGEEPYMIAMTIKDFFGLDAGHGYIHQGAAAGDCRHIHGGTAEKYPGPMEEALLQEDAGGRFPGKGRTEAGGHLPPV